jgi:hypothetical protein
VTSGTIALPATPTGNIALNIAVPTNGTDFTGGLAGQKMTLSFGDTNLTLKTTGNIKIGTDFTPANTNASMVLEKRGSNWVQISRFTGQ